MRTRPGGGLPATWLPCSSQRLSACRSRSRQFFHSSCRSRGDTPLPCWPIVWSCCFGQLPANRSFALTALRPGNSSIWTWKSTATCISPETHSLPPSTAPAWRRFGLALPCRPTSPTPFLCSVNWRHGPGAGWLRPVGGDSPASPSLCGSLRARIWKWSGSRPPSWAGRRHPTAPSQKPMPILSG